MTNQFQTMSIKGEGEFGTYRQVAFDVSIFPLPTTLKALYWFTERYYIQLEWEDALKTRLCVTFRSKDQSESVPESAVGEFCNALIDQSVRAQVQAETQLTRDIIVKKAFSEALSRREQEAFEQGDL